MDMWTDFIGKKVFIEVQIYNGYRAYSAIINEVNYLGKNTEGVDSYFILMTDKFGDKVGVMSTQIKLIQEEK